MKSELSVKINRGILIILLLIAQGCATVPVTGRRQVSLVSQEALALQSAEIYQMVLEDFELSEDLEKKRMLDEVGEDIARAAERFMDEHGLSEDKRLYDWEFFLLEDDDSVNAFVLPGGKTGVFTGMFKVAPDKESLAVVLGHEVAHVIARHGSERMSHVLLVELGRATLAAVLEESPEDRKALWSSVYGVGSHVGVLLPYSRRQESEADRIGLIITAMAGYDPRAALDLWHRMAERQKARPVEFLSTHPLPETRIRDIERALPEALAYYEPSN